MRLHGWWHCIDCADEGEDGDESTANKGAEKHTKNTGHATAVTLTTERVHK